VAVAHLLGRLARREPRRWVFGSLRGFRDDPRYLAEHLVDARPDVEAWWIARSEQEAQAATAAGLHVARLGGRRAAQVQRSAGGAFISNGFSDLEPAHLGGAFVVDLRHGQGLKRVLLDELPMPRPDVPLRERARRLGRRWWVARRLGQIDLVVAPGKWAKDRFVTAFACPPSRIQVLGMPRFDVLLGGAAYERVAGNGLRARLDIGPDRYVVLWLPTWREAGDATWLPRLDASDLDLAATDPALLLLVKPHPFSDLDVYRERLPEHPAVRLLPDAGVDVNAILRESDALVTDYSSAAFDYAILDRPIYFLAPDLDSYEERHGLYEPLESITGGHYATTWAALLRDVAGRDAGGTGRRAAQRIRELSALNADPGSCDRIVSAVAKALRLPQPPRG
jgi:CDP-glycerol glycerophosphotransferase